MRHASAASDVISALRDVILFVGGSVLLIAWAWAGMSWLYLPLAVGMVALPLFMHHDHGEDDMGAIPRAPKGGYHMGAVAGSGTVPTKPPCRHKHVVPVTLSLTGELVAFICLDCDRQLPAEWSATWPIERAPMPLPERR